ncbi:uncharacterized protein EKO05_0001489 [Ascochyta rabiei]|uniref:Uncharacterized protein n=1 Tax=Didymella rabiei TaxID=5454 RepID=A0A163CY63_DIDRA|nr:uncharacterized protein EKO05_0001489 [Ascochyta rabiei]KZM22776.1 hypothetical protein ST47_g6064 [Ascochyta rabiei]UPX10851.1 hypothetical protein EKO05_0001489 [Ascochyta rabiei]
MQSWMSWATFLAILAAGYFYYAPKLNTDTRGRSTARTTTTSSKQVDWSDSEGKPKAAAKQAKKQAKAPHKKSIQDAVQEAGNKAKAEFNAATSAGADASDDSSSASSVRAAPKVPSGRDVSDMLSSSGASANVLSIKASDKPAKATKPKAQKVETPQETKKQRQNRQKVEAQKAQREEDEKQRQIMLEKQRRTAREARGEPAKNGVAAKLPTNNPWAGQSSGGAVQAPSSAPSGQLLDTFDVASTASSSATNGTNNTPDTVSNSGSYNGLPSEEEQMRLAMEDNSAWTTIPKGGKKQKATQVTEESTASTAVPAQSTKPAQALQSKKPENRASTSNSRYGILSEPFTTTEKDSDWPVM